MAKYCFGVDIGGTTVKMGLFTAEGELLDKWEIPTRTGNNGENILPDVAEAVLKKLEEKKLSKEDVAGVGVGAPGPIDSDGVVHVAVNLGWGVFNVEETLSKLVGIPVRPEMMPMLLLLARCGRAADRAIPIW